MSSAPTSGSSYDNRDISFTEVEKLEVVRSDENTNNSNEKEKEKEKEDKDKKVPFWTEDPNVILQYPLEFFPSDSMTFSQKLNAVSRVILVVTIGAFCYRRSIRLVCVSALTFAAIAYMYYSQTSNDKKVRFSDTIEEGFTPYENPTQVLL